MSRLEPMPTLPSGTADAVLDALPHPVIMVSADGRVANANAAAESFFSTLEHEVLSRHHFTTKAQARAVVLDWCHNFYNTRRRHSSAGRTPPNEYEKITADQPAAA